MSDESKAIGEEEALLKYAQAAEEAARAWAEYVKAVRKNAPAVPPSTKSPIIEASSESPDGKLARLPLSDACVEYLKTCKRPQSAKKIWAALERAGRTSEAVDPVKSVNWALKKLVSQGNDEVFSPGFGKWDLKHKYTPNQLSKLLRAAAGRGGRGATEHVSRTKAGIEKARSEGKQIGAPQRINVDQIRELKSQLEDGETIKAACEAARVSYGYYYLHRKEIEAWKEGDPWPPPKERLDETSEPRVRLVT